MILKRVLDAEVLEKEDGRSVGDLLRRERRKRRRRKLFLHPSFTKGKLKCGEDVLYLWQLCVKTRGLAAAGGSLCMCAKRNEGC